MQKSILYAVLNVFSMAFFVHIVWCWSRCWCCCFCQLRMVGYIFLYIFSNLHVWEKSYVLYLHFNLWHCGVFFSLTFYSVFEIQREKERNFPYFHSFSKTFSFCANLVRGSVERCFDFPLNVPIVYVILPSTFIRWRPTLKITEAIHACVYFKFVNTSPYSAFITELPCLCCLLWLLLLFGPLIKYAPFDTYSTIYGCARCVRWLHANIFIWLLETFAFGFSKDKSLLCSKMVWYLSYVNVKIASTTTTWL